LALTDEQLLDVDEEEFADYGAYLPDGVFYQDTVGE
jgi:hypothetical protein